MTQTCELDIKVGEAETYMVSLPRILRVMMCQMEG